MQTLATPRLVLESLVAAHADALYPILADARQIEYLDERAPASLEALRERYRRLESRSPRAALRRHAMHGHGR